MKSQLGGGHVGCWVCWLLWCGVCVGGMSGIESVVNSRSGLGDFWWRFCFVPSVKVD